MNPSMQERLAQRHQRREERRKREELALDQEELFQQQLEAAQKQGVFFDAFGAVQPSPPPPASRTGGLERSTSMGDLRRSRTKEMDASNRGRPRDGAMDISQRGSLLKPPAKDTKAYNNSGGGALSIAPPSKDTRRYNDSNSSDSLAIPAGSQRGDRGREPRRGVQRQRSRSLTDMRQVERTAFSDIITPKTPRTPRGQGRKKLNVQKRRESGNPTEDALMSPRKQPTKRRVSSAAHPTPDAQVDLKDEASEVPKAPPSRVKNLSAGNRRASGPSNNKRSSATKGIVIVDEEEGIPKRSSSTKGLKIVDDVEILKTPKKTARRRSSQPPLQDSGELSSSRRDSATTRGTKKGSAREDAQGANGTARHRKRPSTRRREDGHEDGVEKTPRGTKMKVPVINLEDHNLRTPKGSSKIQASALTMTASNSALGHDFVSEEEDSDDEVLFTPHRTPRGKSLPHNSQRSAALQTETASPLAGKATRRHTTVAPKPNTNTQSQAILSVSQHSHKGDDNAAAWSMANPDQVNKWKSKLALDPLQNSNHTMNSSRSSLASGSRPRRRNSLGGLESVKRQKSSGSNASSESGDWTTTLSNEEASGDETENGERSLMDLTGPSKYFNGTHEKKTMSMDDSMPSLLNGSVPSLMDADPDDSFMELSVATGTTATSVPSLMTMIRDDTTVEMIAEVQRKEEERIIKEAMRASQTQSMLEVHQSNLQIMDDNARNDVAEMMEDSGWQEGGRQAGSHRTEGSHRTHESGRQSTSSRKLRSRSGGSKRSAKGGASDDQDDTPLVSRSHSAGRSKSSKESSHSKGSSDGKRSGRSSKRGDVPRTRSRSLTDLRDSSGRSEESKPKRGNRRETISSKAPSRSSDAAKTDGRKRSLLRTSTYDERMSSGGDKVVKLAKKESLRRVQTTSAVKPKKKRDPSATRSSSKTRAHESQASPIPKTSIRGTSRGRNDGNEKESGTISKASTRGNSQSRNGENDKESNAIVRETSRGASRGRSIPDDGESSNIPRTSNRGHSRVRSEGNMDVTDRGTTMRKGLPNGSKARRASKSPKEEKRLDRRRGVPRTRSRSLTDLRSLPQNSEVVLGPSDSRSNSSKKNGISSNYSMGSLFSSGSDGTGRRGDKQRPEKGKLRRSKTETEDLIRKNSSRSHPPEEEQRQSQPRQSNASIPDTDNRNTVQRHRSNSLTDLRLRRRLSKTPINIAPMAALRVEDEEEDIDRLKNRIEKMEAELKDLPDLEASTELSADTFGSKTTSSSSDPNGTYNAHLAKPEAILKYLEGENEREKKEQQRLKEKMFDLYHENSEAEARLKKTQQYASELEEIHKAEVMKFEALMKNVPVFEKVIEAHAIKLARRTRYIEFERNTRLFYEGRIKSIVRNIQAKSDDLELLKILSDMAGMRNDHEKFGTGSMSSMESTVQTSGTETTFGRR